jgi:single-stranded-DNA-specific exonuclease
VSQRLGVAEPDAVDRRSLVLEFQRQVFFPHQPLPSRVLLAFRLDADEWQGVRRVRFLVEGAEL